MEALFLKLLNLSITAGWLVLFVLVLRLIFRKAPRWIFCLLWGLVALRLALPFSLESALSLIPSAEPIPANIVYEAAPMIDSGIPVVNQVVNPVISETFAPAPVASVNPLQVATFVAAWVWLIGLALMLGYALISYVLLRRRVATATLLQENIKQSERVDSPFVLGLFRPIIYLPYSMDEGNRGHVISHERAHIRRGDHWWKPLGFLILAVYWFNPLIWVAYILFCRDMELACDEKVVANMEQDDRRAYSTALLNCSIRRRSIAACPLAFGEVGVKDRVKGVMNYKKPAFWIILIALLACIVAAVCFLTVPKEDSPHTLEVTGLPAPKSGEDPYADLDGADRAAAFLANADMMSYEFAPLVMHGKYLIPTMAATPSIHEVDGQTFTTNHLQPILELLHHFDLSTLTPVDVTAFDRQDQISSLIHVGDARCRMAIWYDTPKYVDHQGTVGSALVFTFADGTMCAFDGGNLNSYITDPWEAIEQAGSARNYVFNSSITTESNLTVTELATGESKNMNAYSAAYVECVFENTPLLREQVKSEAEFPWKIEILDGSTYWYNAEENLLMTENNKVYAIGGFETVTSNDQVQSMNEIIELALPGFILTPFGYEVTADHINGTVTIEPPASDENLNAATPDATEPEPEPTPGIPAPKGGADPYADLEPAERAAAFLKNADNMSYENSLLMHGEYIMITMEYKPRTEQLTDPASGTTFTQTFDHTNLILESLQKVDLTSLRQMELAEMESFDIQVSTSGLIHVGDARCRAAVWYDQRPALEQEYTAALVFTFSDGTVCAFEEKILGTGSAAANLAYAISTAGSATAYALYPQGGDVSVVQLSTGKTGGTSAYGSAWITAIFENTPRLVSSVRNHNGQFDYQVTLADGSVYLFDDENLLLQTADGQVYPIGGFEESEGAFTTEKLICDLVTGGVAKS